MAAFPTPALNQPLTSSDAAIGACAMRKATLRRLLLRPTFPLELELHRLDCLASHGNLDAYEFVSRFVRETPPEEVRPARLVTGADLKSMGLAPGPQFKEILQAIEEAQLDGRLRARDEALDFVLRHYVPGATPS